MDGKTDKLIKLFTNIDEKLSKMTNGDFANDCVVNHIRRSVGNFLGNTKLIEEVANMEVPQKKTEWFAFLIAAISTGPIPHEINISKVLGDLKSKFDG